MNRLLIALCAILVAAATAAPAAAETTLRLTLQLPLKSHLGQNLTMFKEEVERESKGDIRIEIYDSAQLYKDSEVPQAVGSGAIEMGTVSLTRYAGVIPAVDIFYVPFLFNSEALVRAAVAIDSPVRKPIDEAILGQGTRVLWWQAYGGAIMLSKKAPLPLPSDIKGKKVRVFGKTLGKFIEVLGGAPTLISGSEQYLAYQRGTVDAGMTGVSGVESRKLWQVMDWITVTNHADIEFVVVINEDVWEGLTPEQQSILITAARNAEADVRDRMSEIEAHAYAAAKENGMQVRELSDEEVAAWRTASQPVLDDYLASSGELGAKLAAAAEALRQ
jgi:C4-dicarboxylate-binding protein DctP